MGYIEVTDGVLEDRKQLANPRGSGLKGRPSWRTMRTKAAVCLIASKGNTRAEVHLSLYKNFRWKEGKHRMVRLVPLCYDGGSMKEPPTHLLSFYGQVMNDRGKMCDACCKLAGI